MSPSSKSSDDSASSSITSKDSANETRLQDFVSRHANSASPSRAATHGNRNEGTPAVRNVRTHKRRKIYKVYKTYNYNIYIQGMPPEILPIVQTALAGAASVAPATRPTSPPTAAGVAAAAAAFPFRHSPTRQMATPAVASPVANDTAVRHATSHLPAASGNRTRSSDRPTTPPIDGSPQPSGGLLHEEQTPMTRRGSEVEEEATFPPTAEDEAETRALNEEFNRRMFNIDLDGNFLDEGNPGKPRASQQLTNQDFDEHVEICHAHTSEDQEFHAVIREKYGSKYYDVSRNYSVNVRTLPNGEEVTTLLRKGRPMIRQREVFRAIHDFHVGSCNHRRQATVNSVKQKYGNITRNMIDTYISICPTCLGRSQGKKPRRRRIRRALNEPESHPEQHVTAEEEKAEE
ncbi:hypothetical protein IV203_030160 [Nitzschia inconspicua]|uniref:Integrase zinc-binding domain-containing protein n=1 Tax=Nitzschia inconspicua TaxID=303405 RepID=A0A9K3K553_9STRA|nr:hypothetical protein IV203_004885 [Nitzschia inconspicua]KAG7367489.1 hypothetical protein IV203_030160 [Nitzschia inconspicua]